MEGLLVSLSTCSIFGGTITACQHGVIKKKNLSCPSLSCSEAALLVRKEGMHNKTPCSRLLKMHMLLQCMDLSSRLHMLEAGETLWKQRGLLMAISFSRKVFRTLRLAFIQKSLLMTRFYVCMLVQRTGNVLCCYSYFIP